MQRVQAYLYWPVAPLPVTEWRRQPFITLQRSVLLVYAFVFICFAFKVHKQPTDRGHTNVEFDDEPSRSRPDRADFNNTVLRWQQDNAHLTVSAEAIEDLWQQISGTSDKAQYAANPTQSNVSAPTRKRAKASQSEISAAEQLVAVAMANVGRASAYLFESPRRNRYTRRPAGWSSKARRSSAPSFVPGNDTREAAALLAEHDAAQMYLQGTLFKEYKIPFRTTPGAEPEYRYERSGSVSARDTAGNYWLADLGQRYPGNSPLGEDNANYKVFRNVMDYGAKGDGTTDDTKAINRAISDGNRCGLGCGGSTVKGATIFFPKGTYLVSSSIISMYGSQLVGDVSTARAPWCYRTSLLTRFSRTSVF